MDAYILDLTKFDQVCAVCNSPAPHYKLMTTQASRQYLSFVLLYLLTLTLPTGVHVRAGQGWIHVFQSSC